MKHVSLARVASSSALAAAALLLCAAPAPVAAVDLADAPLFTTVSVPGNLVLSLSVEYPTASTVAYQYFKNDSSSNYTATKTYLGYFDPAKCYVYQVQSPASSSYFAPDSAASSHACTSSATKSSWSGNYLNWASMQSLDEFRWVLTGGNRLVDTASQTILQKTWHSGQDGGGSAPNKGVTTGTGSNSTPYPSPAGTITGATPFNWTTVNTRIWGEGVQMFITNSGSLSTTTPTAYTGQNSYSTNSSGNLADGAVVYSVYVNVAVCDPTVSVESNCVQYGSNYKPEGLMQSYSGKLRYAAFGYLNDGNVKRDGGVLRAGMKYIGPTQPVPGSTAITNSLAEWSATDGTMATNPNPNDATATTNAATAAGQTVSVTQSGVMNYLNKFGYTAGKYKTYDPVSELYYSGIRYLKNLGNVSAYSDLTGGGTSISTWIDGFPVITSWTDPIVYACQKNFILGIGDVNTHRDSDLPGGGTMYTANYQAGQEPSTPSEVTNDSSVNVMTATNMVGTIEGVNNLGTTYVSTGRYDTYFIAGLAYDAHTNDIRSDLAGTQTVNTYWLDVLENQAYVNENIYYYATKYGGFTVPTGFQPYASTNAKNTLTTSSGTVALADSMWHTNTDTNGNDKRPDNYFTANNADVMKSSLTSAFAKISSEATAADSTAFSTPSVNLTSSGGISYAATYDPSTWTGRLIASTITFSSDGTPSQTQQWDARTLLSAATVTASSRKIVTCCTTATSPGLQFTDSALSGSTVISRTNYASFASVPGVSSSAQSKTNYLAYLRGDTSQEIANGGSYRTRTYRLGDIVNSKPVAVGVPNALYYDSSNPGYSTFKSNNSSRKTVVYVGANDGMLHAFDGTTGNSASGSELFAYVPSFVYGSSSTATTSGLATLGNPTFTHHYFVDATPGQFDVDLSNTSGSAVTTPNWHTLLIGGLGKGGTGYYALDITSPSSWTSESAVAGKVMWEFTDSRMGYTYGTPSVIKTKKYGWVVVFTSGYNNSDGVGYFFFVNPATGALLEAVATPSGSTSSPIDMGQHSAYVPDFTDGTADAIYGVDLQGDVWRLDVTAASGDYAAPTRIATLKDSDGNAQPITTRPLIESDTSSLARYVLIGTGQLLGTSDIANANTQSFYAFTDGLNSSGGFYTTSTLPSANSFPITRSQLNAVSDLTVGISGSTAGKLGWYFDLPVTSNIAQRVNVDPQSYSGVVAFAGNLPNGSACSPSGTGVSYATTFSTGKTVMTNASGAALASNPDTNAIISDIAFLNVNGSVYLYNGDSLGNMPKEPTNLGSNGSMKQLNWRDVPLGN